MFLQRRDQYLAWQNQKAFVETSGYADRPFHKRGDFLDQAVVDHCLAAEARCGLSDLFNDALLAVVGINDDPGIIQRFGIVIGVGKINCVRVMKAMAVLLPKIIAMIKCRPTVILAAPI